MTNTPKNPNQHSIVPGRHEPDAWRRIDIDINERQERINECDDTYMQAPDPWPDPDGDED